MISENENNNDFQLEKYFYQLVIINNQDIFNVKGKAEPCFFVNYTKYIFANLAS